ncbi:DEAD/DEAH box helicase [Sporosarcina sp. FSL K6-1508]|uniref:DEAD/DEAH box helicase n=1 Tax=Sporosarcina sp. FSL K6-1508 TaxID=2921553 RepID=UPI0030F7BC5C
MNYIAETTDNPKMFQVYLKQAWHEVFCYALAFEKSNRYEDKLLFTIVSGSDSALQSIRGAIDIGSTGGLKFGYGTKELTGYRFHSEKPLAAEKGKYEKFPMTLNQNRKALAIVHDDVLNNSKYVLSFDGNPATDIAQLLGGSTYGLHILPEWEDTVLEELIRCHHLRKHELYKDESLFPEGLYLYSIDLTEEQADLFIERLLQEKIIQFPKEGDGNCLLETKDLTSYLMTYNEAMVEKLSEKVTPTHNPIEDDSLAHFKSYPRELFPVQSHTATAIVKRLMSQKSVIIQGEMSTGKSSIMTAVADGIHAMKGKSGYHVCLMCPPNLTKKWPEEIKILIPHAAVHVIKNTTELIRFHSEWVRQGKQKPKVPTFFVISFTTMRGDARTVPAVRYKYSRTTQQRELELPAYRNGLYCSACGKPHQTVEHTITDTDEDGNEFTVPVTHSMTDIEFGESRRLHNSVKPANAFCFHCQSSLWTKTAPNRFSNFAEWCKYENKIIHAINQENSKLLSYVQSRQPEIPTAVGMPRRIAAVEYIRRKMNNFFDLSIVDEVHELKGGMTAQGNALGSIVQASKKVVAGTGTLFGGKSEDIYYLLWRMFPYDMVASGFRYEEVTRFNEEYGNVEETVVVRKEAAGEYTNTNSRGGDRRTSKKVLPGISPFIYGRYMIQNVINVRLKDVWPEPVELVDTPTIFVPMSSELESHYRGMISAFEYEIDAREDGYKLYMSMTDYGIAYADNPFTFPSATFKTESGAREVIWEATHLSEDCTLPKEKKLQEIIEGEMSEGRKSIVYVKDTGSSVEQRDVRPRLKRKLEEIGAKVCVLDSSTTSTNARSEWLKKKIEVEGYDVCIVSQELVKVGLDLLCTPTLIYYQFSWSLFTINQSSRRSWRIGQTEECRLFYLAYADTFQEKMAELIALKNRATAAINGDVSADGLSAMLGDDGDLQSMLIESVKKGGTIVKGSAEEWIHQTSDRARELLANIGKKKEKLSPTILMQFEKWIDVEITGEVTKRQMLLQKEELSQNIARGQVTGFTFSGGVLEVDMIEAFGVARDFISDGAILYHLTKIQQSIEPEVAITTETQVKHSPVINIVEIKQTHANKRKSKNGASSEGQLVFDLFG